MSNILISPLGLEPSRGLTQLAADGRCAPAAEANVGLAEKM